MFKTDFYKTKYGGRNQDGIFYSFEKVSGWGEHFEAPDGTPIELRFDKENKFSWNVTEESTGMGCLNQDVSTLKEAIKLMTPENLEALSEILKTEGTKSIIDKLDNFKMSLEE